jgi:hypothetical protein
VRFPSNWIPMRTWIEISKAAISIGFDRVRPIAKLPHSQHRQDPLHAHPHPHHHHPRQRAL